MNYFKQSARLLFISIASLSTMEYADGSNHYKQTYHRIDYKKPDLRQQRQHVQHQTSLPTSKRNDHLQQRKAKRLARAKALIAFVKKHKKSAPTSQISSSEALAKANKLVAREQKREVRVCQQFGLNNNIGLNNNNGTRLLIALLLIPMCLASDGVNVAQKITSTNPSIVYSRPYSEGQELKTYGPCETLPNGSKFCCDIGTNYTVTCCVHPNIKEICTYPNATVLSRCIFIDPVGIIGDQIELPKANFTADILAAEEMCTNSYKIAEEAQHMLVGKPITMKYHCLTNKKFIANNLPTLVRATRELSQKYNLRNMPKIELIGDPYDPPSMDDISPSVNTMASPPVLRIPQLFARYISDAEQASIYAHELQHIKQNPNHTRLYLYNNITHNNFELEADIASVLATRNICGAALMKQVTFSLHKLDPSKILMIQAITRENITERVSQLKSINYDRFHPDDFTRIVVMLATYKKAEIARKILELTN